MTESKASTKPEMPASPPLSKRRKRRYVTVLNVALDLMDRNGFDGVSVRELAELADITPTTIYNVFGSKEGLLSAAIEFRTRSFIREGARENQTGFDALLVINRRVAATCIRSRELINSIATMLARDSTLFAVRQIYRVFHCNYIREIQQQGGLAATAKPETLAFLLMLSHNAILNHWASNEIGAEHLATLFDLETCKALHPVAKGATKRQIDSCYAERMEALNSIDYGALFDKTQALPSQLNIAELADEVAQSGVARN